MEERFWDPQGRMRTGPHKTWGIFLIVKERVFQYFSDEK